MGLLSLVAFFVLIAVGLRLGELGAIRTSIFIGIWIVALVVCGLLDLPRAVSIVVEVILDITLILMIFSGDIRLS